MISSPDSTRTQPDEPLLPFSRYQGDTPPLPLKQEPSRPSRPQTFNRSIQLVGNWR